MQGCWTCRLRRKKCSGEQPTCSRCRQLNVTCHGYGPKPSWMDGGNQEKGVLAKIRKSVKLTTDGQRRSRALRGMKKTALGHTGRDCNRVVSLKEQGEPSSGPEPTSFNRKSPLPPILSQTLLNGSSTSEEQSTLPWTHDAQLESFLLMHYLDFVFPLQFPFYIPQASEGGRGWYLGLLMRAKPLYNAALTLAAYHHRKTSPCKVSNAVCDGFEGFYSLALNGLREHIGYLSKKELREGLKDGIEVLACVVQLIMFEVARGGFEDWQPHLKAIPDIHPFLETYCTRPSMRNVSRSSADNYPDLGDLSFIDHAAMEFFSSVILHFDILACASTGRGPQYADICAAALGAGDSKVRLERIMGCENWAMVLIREIAVLWDCRRKDGIEKGVWSRKDLRMAKNIERRLDAGLEKLSDEWSQSAKDEKTRPSRDLAIHEITNAYANAAKIYLNVFVSGPNPELFQVTESVSLTIIALAALPEPTFLRSVVWPFCIAGCMARDDQRQTFRSLVSAADIDQSVFGSSWRALEVMEMCWRMRDEGKSVDWLDAMEGVGYQVLLV